MKEITSQQRATLRTMHELTMLVLFTITILFMSYQLIRFIVTNY